MHGFILFIQLWHSSPFSYHYLQFISFSSHVMVEFSLWPSPSALAESLNRGFPTKAYSAHALSTSISSPHLPPLSAGIRASGPAADYNSDSAESLTAVPYNQPKAGLYANPGLSASDQMDFTDRYRPGLGIHPAHSWHQVPRINLSTLHSSESDDNNNQPEVHGKVKVKRKRRKNRRLPERDASET